jgi:hypothetical protein
MLKRTPLVCQQLGKISREALGKYQDIIRQYVGGYVLKLFKKTLSLNGSSPSLIIEEGKQDVNREFGFHSPSYRETRTGAGKGLSI